jgi:hypothetical protein
MRGCWRNFQNRQTEKAIVGSTCNPKKVSIGITLWLLLAGITMSLSGCGGGPLRAYYYQDDQHYRYYETTSGDVLLVSPGGQVGNATHSVREQGYPSIRSEDRSSASGNDPQPELPAPEISEGSEAQWFPWSIREEGHLVWNNGPKPESLSPDVSNVSDPKWFPWGNWPLSSPTSKPAAQSSKPENEAPKFYTLPILGTTTWKSDKADWDMAGYEIAPETGACKPYALSITAAAFVTPYEPFYKKRPCWNSLWDVPASILGDALVASLIAMRIGLAFGGH